MVEEDAEKGLKYPSLKLSVLKKVLIVAVVYLIFYYELSITWLIAFVVLSALRDQQVEIKRIEKQQRRIKLSSSEKEAVLAQLDDLPAWVVFPDVERTEWLNKVIKQIWPQVNKHLVGHVKETLESSIKKKVDKYKFSKFHFDNVEFGMVAPRIDGIKVYDKNMDRNEVIMDINISYASDCEITFTFSGMKGGIEDFRLDGLLRVILKPLLPRTPFIGAVQIFFLNKPSIDFELVGIADVLDTPGLNLGDLVKKIVYKKLASTIVLPKKLTKRITKTVELKLPEPEGVLRMHVIGAKHLMRKDVGLLGKGKSDPYAVITVGSQEFRTKTIQNTLDPKWDYWCEFVIMEPDGQEIFIHIWDYDDASEDETLGSATIEVADIVRKGQDDMWITLEQVQHGMVHLRFTWLQLSTDYDDLKAAIKETQLLCVNTLCTSLLTVFVDSIKDLPQVKATTPPDTYVILTVGKETLKSRKAKKSFDPVYEEAFLFLVTNPETENLFITLKNKKTEEEMGQFEYHLRGLGEHENLYIEKQSYALLKAGPETRIILSMNLRIFKRETPIEEETYFINQDSTLSREASVDEMRVTQEEVAELASALLNGTPPSSKLSHRSTSVTSSAGEYGLGRIQLTLKYSTMRQKLIVIINRIANLPLKDPRDIPDPYVKLYLLPERSRESKRKTHIIKDNCNPVYDESFEYVISESDLCNQRLEVTVCTQKQLFSTSSGIMGKVVVYLADHELSQPYVAWYDLQPED